jgi:hypothetical protein
MPRAEAQDHRGVDDVSDQHGDEAASDRVDKVGIDSVDHLQVVPVMDVRMDVCTLAAARGMSGPSVATGTPPASTTADDPSVGPSACATHARDR